MADIDSEIYKLAQEFKKALESDEQAYLAKIAQRWQALEARLVERYAALAAKVADFRNGGVTPVPSGLLLELEQVKLAIADTVIEIDRMASAWKLDIESRQLEMYAVANADALAMLEVAMIAAGLDIGAVSLGGHLPVEAIAKLMEASMNGTPLGDLLTARFGEHMEDALAMLVDGVAQGINPREIARRMVKELGPLADNALTIARTESLKAYRLATNEAYRLSGIVKQYKRVSARNARTCMACLMDDGAVYNIDVPLPEHPNGRCTTVPILPGADPEWQHGKEWFQQQDEQTQRRMMGSAKYDAWKEGRFELDALVSVKKDEKWGDSLAVVPLKDL